MTPQHHVSDDLLVSYEAGSLAEGWSLAVATHLALCPSCRERARAAADVGGAMLETIDGVELDDGALQNVLARIESDPPAEQPRRQISRDMVIPEPLRSYVGGDVGEIKWKKLGMSSHHVPLTTTDGETSVRLLRIPAGEEVPHHGHRGAELTVVLSGALIDDDETFRRGDIEQADESVEHQPKAGPGEDCICLAVTDAPLRFKSVLVRLVQPFLRI